MYVGIGALDIYIEHARSLKDKRQVVKKILDQVKNKFPVSIAEVDAQDLWQRAVLGFTMVSSSAMFIEEIFVKVEEFIDNLHICQILDIKKEIFSW